MMNRRVFVQRIAAAPIRSAIIAGLLHIGRPQPAKAVPFMAAVTIAQTALGLINMFRSQAGGVPYLLSIQSDVLKEISQQVSLLHKNLIIISRDLEEVKNLLGTLPDAIVENQNSNLIEAAALRRRELLDAYTMELGLRGITAARALTESQFEDEVLKRIRAGRDALLSGHSERQITTLALSLQAEVQVMIMLDYGPSLIKAAINSYKEWFGRWLDKKNDFSLVNQIKELESLAENTKTSLLEAKLSCLEGGLYYSVGEFLRTTERVYTLDPNNFNEVELADFKELDDLKNSTSINYSVFENLRVGKLVSSASPKEFIGYEANRVFDSVFDSGVLCVPNQNNLASEWRASQTVGVTMLRHRLLAKVSLRAVAESAIFACDDFASKV